MENKSSRLKNYNFENIVDVLIRLAVLYFLINWCFNILLPFGAIMVWGAVISLAVYPGYNYLLKLFRGKKITAVLIMTVLLMSIIVIPGWFIAGSMIDGINQIQDLYAKGLPLIPPPGEITRNWPEIAKPIVDLWKLASENLQKLILQYKDMLAPAANWLFKELTGIGKGIVQFIASVILSGVFLYYSETLSASMLKLFKKIAGDNGDSFALISVVTVRSVFKGVIGVAFIQAALAGIGLFAAGVPYAGLWTVICLITGIIQLGVGPVVIPISIYMFSASDSLTAMLLAVWMLFVTISDNILKPILMGKGAQVPTLIIFLGSIGGFIYAGFIGLFMGAIVLSIGYKLFNTWLLSESVTETLSKSVTDN